MSIPDKSRFSILTVDDNKENLKVVSNFLKNEGYQIALSVNADDAVKILEEHTIDLILLDVMMPGTDGFTLCRRLKEDQRFADIPVIFLTAKTDPDDLVEGFKAGGLDYITKPFNKEELLARVNNQISLAHARQEIIKQTEEIKKINQTKDRLYSVIAHDIKSPFSNISMLISTLAEGYLQPGSEEYEEILQSINSSTQETYALLENLLQWTRSQTGTLERSPEPLSLEEIIAKATRFLGPHAKKKDISLTYDVPADLTIEADRNMMQSVFQNLINNALKFTNEGGQVTVTGKKQGDKVTVEVQDNGIGIAEENLKKLFDDKGQFTTRGTGDEKGSGLGLILVSDFVEKNYGTIDVKSKEGEGTSVIVTLPPANE